MKKLSKQIAMDKGVLKTKDVLSLIDVKGGESFRLSDEEIKLADQKSLEDFDAMQMQEREQNFYAAKALNDGIVLNNAEMLVEKFKRSDGSDLKKHIEEQKQLQDEYGMQL